MTNKKQIEDARKALALIYGAAIDPSGYWSEDGALTSLDSACETIKGLLQSLQASLQAENAEISNAELPIYPYPEEEMRIKYIKDSKAELPEDRQKALDNYPESNCYAATYLIDHGETIRKALQQPEPKPDPIGVRCEGCGHYEEIPLRHNALACCPERTIKNTFLPEVVSVDKFANIIIQAEKETMLLEWPDYIALSNHIAINYTKGIKIEETK